LSARGRTNGGDRRTPSALSETTDSKDNAVEKHADDTLKIKLGKSPKSIQQMGAGVIESENEVFAPSSEDSGGAVPASIGDFNIVLEKGPDLTANTAASAAFDRAAAMLETLFDDNITIHIDAEIAPLGTGILGSTTTASYAFSYDIMRTSMQGDAASDETIVSSIPTAANVIYAVQNGTYSVSSQIIATRANALAVGVSGATMTSGPNSLYDG
jgi:hypothetical protein